jgi:hypothetical protein
MTTSPNNLGSCDPWHYPSVYDSINFGGVRSPGRCVVGEFVRKYEFDTKRGKGVAGGVSTRTGLPPAKGRVVFWAWEPSHFTAWDAFVALLKQYPELGAVNAATIYYPTLADIDVSQVTVAEISSWVPTSPESPNGMWTRWVEFLEYYPPPKKDISSTPTTAVENVEEVEQQEDPNSVGQNEAASLLQQLQQPGGTNP